HHGGEALGIMKRSQERDGAALREAREHDAAGGQALAADQLLGELLRSAQSRFILRSAAELQDVVPGAHAHALVDGHRPYRRVREDEAHRPLEPELGHDRLEVVAVGAEAMQPDDRRFGIAAGLDTDGVHQKMRLNQASDRPAPSASASAAAAAKKAVISVSSRWST